MTAARKRAEEALRMFDQTATPEPHEVYLYRAIAALREILAEEAPPAADEVREAAERCRMRVEHAFDPDCPCDQNTNCYAGAIADMDALLSALDARGGAG